MTTIDLSWDNVFKYVDALAGDIHDSNPSWHPDRIVAVARGGLIPATLLSHRLSIDRVDALNVRFGHQYVNSVYDIFINSADTSDRILVVDDIIDSGTTFERLWRDGRELCEHRRMLDTWHFQVKFAALIHNTKAVTTISPHYAGCRFEKDADEWVVFPWETDISTKRKQANQ